MAEIAELYADLIDRNLGLLLGACLPLKKRCAIGGDHRFRSAVADS